MKCNSKFSLLLLVVFAVSILSCVIYAQEDVEKNDLIPDSQGTQVQEEIEKPAPQGPTQPKPVTGGSAEEAENRLDRSISILNTVATLMGGLVGLITIVVMIAIAVGLLNYQLWTKLKAEAKKSVEEIKKAAQEVKPLVEKIRTTKEEVENLRVSIGETPSLSEPLSDELKKKLDEYGKKIEFLEEFGMGLGFDDYLNRASDHYYKEQYDIALENIDKAIELKPDHTIALSNRGAILAQLDLYEDALTACDKAIELNPDYVDAWNNKGVALRNLGRLEEAIIAFDQAIKLKPDYASAWYNKACLYSMEDDKDKALENLAKAVELDVSNKEEAKKEKDFERLWEDEEFKRIVS